MNTYKLLLSLSFGLLFLSFKPAEPEITTNNFNSLFKIERSKDANQIFYDVNVNETGQFDAENPITIYWRRNTEGGKIKPLTWIQKKYAYGLKFINVNDDYAVFQFVSYNKMFFTLKKTKDNHFEVFTKYHNRIINVKRIFIQLEGGSFWFPKIPEVKIFAMDVKTGEEVLEIIKP